ncbi:MAG: ribonuclease Z, partial [Thermoprotei archaeon ex4572_64]
SRSIDAAIMARKVNAKLLILTHISTRYRSDEELLTSEVVKIFPNTMIAKDLLKINFTLNTVID